MKIIHFLLVGRVLHYINPCRLFNARSCLYIYVKYEDINDLLTISLYVTVLKWTNLICLQTVKRFQVLLSNINYSIQHWFV